METKDGYTPKEVAKIVRDCLDYNDISLTYINCKLGGREQLRRMFEEKVPENVREQLKDSASFLFS